MTFVGLSTLNERTTKLNMQYKAILTQKKAGVTSQSLAKTAKLKLVEAVRNSWQHELRSRIISGLLTMSLGAICYLFLKILVT